MKLKIYQEKAVDKLLVKSKEFLQLNRSCKITFKAPTGSGKTIMMAEYLKQLVLDREVKIPLCFIWAAPRKLHIQSRTKLEKYYQVSRALECSDFEELTDRRIIENEILFLNWESINKKDKNTIVKENERDYYLSKIIENTKETGCEIVLIIDESHHHATSDISIELISDIAPKLTIEVSATPYLKDPDDIVKVFIEEVINEGMIKKLIRINPDFENDIIGDKIKSSLAGGSDFKVLDCAVSKRKQLEAAYEEIGKNINPLLLIQVPDKNNLQDELIKDDIIRHLRDQHDVSVENGKLAIYLSEEKENLENISINNQETEVLIFKQAIALGWDCPRAHILALFRDWNKIVFSVQTLGRIMRMPEPNKGHYTNEILNNSYVYTNNSNIYIKEDLARDYITTFTSNRIDNYEAIKLMSVHSKRLREKTRLNPMFTEIFIQETIKYKLDEKINLENQKISMSIISDFEKQNIDELANKPLQASFDVWDIPERDLQKLFDHFVMSNLTPYYPEDRSLGRVKESIYKFYIDRCLIHYVHRFSDVINITLSECNKQHFINVIESAKIEYKKLTELKEASLEEDKEWEVPESISYGERFEEKPFYKKSVMQPFFYEKKGWGPEKEFIKFIDAKPNIEWWFKNSEGFGTYFAVPYTENGINKPFYVDFIVKFTDGSIGLYDTKSGRTISDSKEKSDGLLAYIKEQNHLGKNLKGGLVTNSNQIYNTGAWLVYTGEGKDLNKDDLSNWDYLEV